MSTNLNAAIPMQATNTIIPEVEKENNPLLQ